MIWSEVIAKARLKQKCLDQADAARAKAEYQGELFDQFFRYRKGRQLKVMISDQSIARKYRELKKNSSSQIEHEDNKNT
jgi:hypothetical protein